MIVLTNVSMMAPVCARVRARVCVTPTNNGYLRTLTWIAITFGICKRTIIGETTSLFLVQVKGLVRSAEVKCEKFVNNTVSPERKA